MSQLFDIVFISVEQLLDAVASEQLVILVPLLLRQVQIRIFRSGGRFGLYKNVDQKGFLNLPGMIGAFILFSMIAYQSIFFNQICDFTSDGPLKPSLFVGFLLSNLLTKSAPSIDQPDGKLLFRIVMSLLNI